MEFVLHPAVLQGLGLILTTDLSIAAPHAALLSAAGKPIPPAIRVRLLVDTGATSSCVRHNIAEAAGLKLISASVPVAGVGVVTTGKKYLGRIQFAFPSKIIDGMGHTIWVDTEITSIDLPSPHIDGLIGRDVLSHFELSYSGPTGRTKMRYVPPDQRAPVPPLPAPPKPK